MEQTRSLMRQSGILWTNYNNNRDAGRWSGIFFSNLLNTEQMFVKVCTFKIDYAIMGKNH